MSHTETLGSPEGGPKSASSSDVLFFQSQGPGGQLDPILGFLPLPFPPKERRTTPWDGSWTSMDLHGDVVRQVSLNSWRPVLGCHVQWRKLWPALGGALVLGALAHGLAL